MSVAQGHGSGGADHRTGGRSLMTAKSRGEIAIVFVVPVWSYAYLALERFGNGAPPR